MGNSSSCPPQKECPTCPKCEDKQCPPQKECPKCEDKQCPPQKECPKCEDKQCPPQKECPTCPKCEDKHNHIDEFFGRTMSLDELITTFGFDKPLPPDNKVHADIFINFLVFGTVIAIPNSRLIYKSTDVTEERNKIIKEIISEWADKSKTSKYKDYMTKVLAMFQNQIEAETLGFCKVIATYAYIPIYILVYKLYLFVALLNDKDQKDKTCTFQIWFKQYLTKLLASSSNYNKLGNILEDNGISFMRFASSLPGNAIYSNRYRYLNWLSWAYLPDSTANELNDLVGMTNFAKVWNIVRDGSIADRRTTEEQQRIKIVNHLRKYIDSNGKLGDIVCTMCDADGKLVSAHINNNGMDAVPSGINGYNFGAIIINKSLSEVIPNDINCAFYRSYFIPSITCDYEGMNLKKVEQFTLSSATNNKICTIVILLVIVLAGVGAFFCYKYRYNISLFNSSSITE